MKPRFQCVGPECDRCCYGAETHGSVVQLMGKDVLNLGEDMAKVTLKRFSFDTGRPVADAAGEYVMYIRPGERCVLYEDGVGCTVHDRKPDQCARYPTRWGSLQSVVAWEREKERCPGIGQGPRVKLHQVGRRAA